MGHPPGNFPPGRCPFGPLQLGHILKDDDHSHIITVIITDQGRRYQKSQCPVFDFQFKLFFYGSLFTFPKFLKKFVYDDQIFRVKNFFISFT